MSADLTDRTFERWALAGAAVLALAGLAAFMARRTPPAAETALPEQSSDRLGGGDLVRVRIGGERPPDMRSADDRGERVLPDPPPPAPSPPTSPPPEPEPPATQRTVIVQPGETLGRIAERELGTVRRLPEILDLNEIEDPDMVRAGTELKLPAR